MYWCNEKKRSGIENERVIMFVCGKDNKCLYV